MERESSVIHVDHIPTRLTLNDTFGLNRINVCMCVCVWIDNNNNKGNRNDTREGQMTLIAVGAK